MKKEDKKMTRYTKKYKLEMTIGGERLTIKERPHLLMEEEELGRFEDKRVVTGDAVNKLSALEDIEEELGIDLVTLCKAFKNGIWSKGGCYPGSGCYLDNEPYFIEPGKIELGSAWYFEFACKGDCTNGGEEALCLYMNNSEEKVFRVRVKDYGRTWALTKEELE